MNLLKDKIKSKNTNYIKSYNWEELKNISKKQYNIVILQRQKDNDIQRFLEKFIESEFTDNIYVCSKNLQVIELLHEHLSKYSFLYEKGYYKFLEDIEIVVKNFSNNFHINHIELFFGILDTTKCPLFHYDRNYLRLICTYMGKGTLWLDKDNVNYNEFDSRNNSKIALEQTKINSIKEFDIAILKGSRYHNDPKSAVIHKSPDIKSGEKRILLRVDAIME